MSADIPPFLWAEFVRLGRTLVPRPEDRTPLTLATAPYMMIQFIPFLAMAYLVRRPNTYILRLLILPILIVTALHAAFGYVWTNPRLNVYNWGAALYCFVLIGKSLDWALVKEGRFKQGEHDVGAMEEPAVASKEETDSAPGDAAARKRPLADVLPRGLEDALEIAFALRGLGWDYGRDVPVPAFTRPTEPKAYLRATAKSFLLNFLALDLLESMLKLVPGVGSPEGASIFLPHLPPLQRYTLSTAIHFATGFSLLAGFGMVYDLCTLIAVGVLGHSPTSWPPVLDAPWAAESLHDFWARRWHQLLRQTFYIWGGRPGRALFGNIGLVFGTFLASGLFHECSMYAMGRGWDARVVLFFLMQGGSVVGERIWRKVTGRRVDGILGTAWVYFDIGILGQPLVDAWHSRGLAGGMVIPPFVSPARLAIIPAARALLKI
ncbi:hypothetical protein PENSPDRAFT_682524 [Peniophora sp. CONT]|nr:hypothetical protein PENSPDRAFT_682524 [Peniophora sp. CONT]